MRRDQPKKADRRRLIKLSKFLALLLRHQPERFALELDEEGWASLSEVMEIVQGLPNFRWANYGDVKHIVAEGSGDGKRRFEIEEGHIRARYGHTLGQPIRYEACTPPPLLYHGTSPDALGSIRREGLRPMERQYVHLSPDRETATRVGARHTEHPTIITIHAAEAHAQGITFHKADETVYLTKTIPADYLEFPDVAP